MQHILATYEKRFGEDYKNAWGKAVEGAQVRLRTDKKAWGINEDPSFQVDLRNKGKQELFIAYPQWFEVEVDGKRHASKSWHSGMPRSIGFGDRLTYSLSLSDFLPSPAAGDDQPLLRPGKHAIRVALAKVGYRDGKGVMQLSGRKLGAVSNPVEIEMTRPEPAGAEIRKETPP